MGAVNRALGSNKKGESRNRETRLTGMSILSEDPETVKRQLVRMKEDEEMDF
jgi:hypothetical protein